MILVLTKKYKVQGTPFFIINPMFTSNVLKKENNLNNFLVYKYFYCHNYMWVASSIKALNNSLFLSFSYKMLFKPGGLSSYQVQMLLLSYKEAASHPPGSTPDYYIYDLIAM